LIHQSQRLFCYGVSAMQLRRIAMLAWLVLLLPAALACSLTKPEPFDLFLNRFRADANFATARVNYPLKYETWAYGADNDGKDESSVTVSWLQRKEIESWPPLDNYLQENKLDAEIVRRTRHARVVRVSQANSDWLLLYHFSIAHGCWRLNKIENQSL